jgi:hypothetical protein
MSYFSSKSTWLSLVDFAEPENSPEFPASETGSTVLEKALPMTPEDYDYMRITRDLRHRLFFHFKEWEFGPALLEDHINLAQSESDSEEALAHYCHARHVAVTLVKRNAQPFYLMAVLETNHIIAGIHKNLGNIDSCALYAREGLNTIKKNKFAPSLDMQITKLTFQFTEMLGHI